MSQTPAQTLINTGADSSLASIYPENAQQIPLVGNASIYITNKTEFVTNIVNSDVAGGANQEIQFNIGDRLVGDSGLTYDMDTDSMTLTGNIIVGNVKTDNLKYANGSPWVFPGTYGNSNVYNYMANFTGNITANNITGTKLYGNAAGLDHITGANVTGTVANATYAVSAGSATTAATVTISSQPNITQVGILSSVNCAGTVSGALFSGSGANLTNIPAGNLSGTAANANYSVYAGTAYSVSGGNVAGAVGSANMANYATTVTGAAQSNITSLGTLTGLTLSGGITANGNIVLNPLGKVVVSNTTASTNRTSGALTVTGGIGSNGNIHATHFHAYQNIYSEGQVYAGNGSLATSFTNPLFIGKDVGTQYVQMAIVNSANTGSSDYSAYGDNGSDTEAWSDMGFTSSAFSDANYTITKSNDGYFFVQGGQDLSGYIGGNLVIATGDKGATGYRDIIFATGGFLSANEKFRYSHANNALVPYTAGTMSLGNTTRYFSSVHATAVYANLTTSGEVIIATDNAHGGAGYAGIFTMTNTTVGATNANKYLRLDFNGNVELLNSGYTATILQITNAGLTTTNLIKTNPVLASSLPTANATYTGARGFVTDADCVTFGNLLVGSAGNLVPVYCDGTDWRVG